jgi:hypothetical protein
VVSILYERRGGGVHGEDSCRTNTGLTNCSFLNIILYYFIIVGSAIATMTMTSGHVVDAACWTTIGMAPLAAYQKRHLKSLGGLRGQQNILRDHVNELYLQVRKTKQSVDKLEGNVDK